MVAGTCRGSHHAFGDGANADAGARTQQNSAYFARDNMPTRVPARGRPDALRPTSEPLRMENAVKIHSVHAREILDSRGNPTVEVDVVLESGARGRAAVPSGASTGTREALELRDGDKHRYGGKGVLKAVDHVNGEIARAIVGQGADQRTIDAALQTLDGTSSMGRLGANAVLGVSMALARASAESAGVPLHEHLATLVPVAAQIRRPRSSGADDEHPERRRACRHERGFSGVHGDAGWIPDVRRGAPRRRRDVSRPARIAQETRLTTGVGDEGGFAPSLASNREAVELVLEAIRSAGYHAGEDMFLALDVASSEFWDEKTGDYTLKKSGEGTKTSQDMIRLYEDWIREYPIVSIEDGLAEGDWTGWRALTTAIGGRTQLVGDDVFVTNPSILRKGIDQGIGNALLVKLNQIGSVSETLSAVEMARQAGYASVISHRSGETEDTTIADLAVATCAGQIKTGSASRSDRTARYNQLLRIEADLGREGPLRRARGHQAARVGITTAAR